VTYCWKALDEGYNFPSNLISIGGHAKLWAPKVTGVLVVGILGVLVVGILGFPLGSPETK